MTVSTPATRHAGQSPLGGVSLRHLAALDAIAREGSFGGAADRLGYVQSAISQQLADLERLVGVRLVERSRGSALVSLTQAGQLLLAHAETVLETFGEAQADLDALAAGSAGTLRLGTFHSVAATLLPRMTAAFGQAYPGFKVEVTLTNPDIPLLDRIEEARLDLAFGELPAPGRRVEQMDLMDDPVVLLVSRRSHVVRADAPPSLDDVADLPLIGFHSTSRFHVELLNRLAARGFDTEMAYRVDLNSTLQALVASDLGVAVVPKLTIDPADPETIAVELPELPPRQISLIWASDRPRPPASVGFGEIAASVIAGMTQD
jgi:DNA-binding transcriptional LysR family regulator